MRENHAIFHRHPWALSLDTVLLVTGFFRGTAQYSVHAAPDAPERIQQDIVGATTEGIKRYEQASFEYGLQRILDGLEQHIERHAC